MSSTVLVITAPLPSILALACGVGGPQRQVVPQQLHDQGAVLVAVLVQGVQLGDGVVKCLKQKRRRETSNKATTTYSGCGFPSYFIAVATAMRFAYKFCIRLCFDCNNCIRLDQN